MNDETLYTEIARQLIWEPAENRPEIINPRGEPKRQLLLRKDGQRIAITLLSWRLHLPDLGPDHFSPEGTSTITVAIQRGAATIAHEIERRLLPQAETFWAAAAEWEDGRNDRQEGISAAKTALLSFPGSRTVWDGSINGPGSLWRAEIRSPDSVCLELPSLTPAQAVTVAELLSTQQG